jgi:hypothetical protein
MIFFLGSRLKAEFLGSSSVQNNNSTTEIGFQIRREILRQYYLRHATMQATGATASAKPVTV